MAILSSSQSVSRTGSNHQVPLVIISQPLPGPITGQNSSPAAPGMADQDDADGAVDSTVDLVLELENISNETLESQTSTNVTSRPVADGPSASEAAAASGEDGALHVRFVLRAVKVFRYWRLFSACFKYPIAGAESPARGIRFHLSAGGNEDGRTSAGSRVSTR